MDIGNKLSSALIDMSGAPAPAIDKLSIFIKWDRFKSNIEHHQLIINFRINAY